MANSKLQLVVAGVIRDGQGRILLARRLPLAHLGGLWEFPGGTVEDGESPEEALARELKEELGVEVVVKEPLTFARHQDGQRNLLLLFYQVSISQGEPVGLEGQDLCWFRPQELSDLPVPPADKALVRRMSKG